MTIRCMQRQYLIHCSGLHATAQNSKCSLRVQDQEELNPTRMTLIPGKQINMPSLTHTDTVSATSLDKLETQLAACFIDKSDSVRDVTKVDSAITDSWDWHSEPDTSIDDDTKSDIESDTETSVHSQSSQDYFSLPKVRARRPSHPLGGPRTYQNILSLTPSSEAPSSPTISFSSSTSSDSEQPQQPPSSLQGLNLLPPCPQSNP
jgi:hypothetical protein